MSVFAEVIVSVFSSETDHVFYYSVPEALRDRAVPGKRVLAPFGRGGRTVEGFIVGICGTAPIAGDKIKNILAVPDDEPLLSVTMLELARWMREKYYTTLAACLKCIMPAGTALKDGSVKNRSKIVRYASISQSAPENTVREIIDKGGARGRVLKLLSEQGAITPAEIIKRLGVSASPINTLNRDGLVVFESVLQRRDVIDPAQTFPDALTLTPEQSEAVGFLVSELTSARTNRVKPVLIHGVTGSGKTEIYLRLIEEALALGKQAIMLVPEISLTPQAVDALSRRFGGKVTVTHSRLSASERLDQWLKARDNQVSVIIGPRSAIFTPFSNLGLIVIDEEHEHTYKSDTTPKYNVIEVAEKLSELTGALVVSGSATPCVETFYRAEIGDISLITLSNRVNNRPPEVNVVDMRLELANGNRSIFSTKLFKAIEENIENKRQTILFMNRRGHSTFVSCRQCGYVLECENCNVNYTYHLYDHKLMCHYCGKTERVPETCPICGSPYIRYFGAGTQKIEEEITRSFPKATVIRMDMDTTSRKNSHARIINSFSTGEADILVGTQMIAKGLNFPNVSLVGIISADSALNMGDFRSAETAFQLITQVSGRAGRAELPGRVFVQTYCPEHYSVTYAAVNDYAGFYRHEIALRRQMQYPPFSHVFMVLCTGPDERKIITVLNNLALIMNRYNRKGFFEMLGPAPAIVSKINNNYRWKILAKGEDEKLLVQFVFYCTDKLKKLEDVEGISFNLTLDPRSLA